VHKASLKPGRRRWEEAFAYIASQKQLSDIVVSGGDSYYLQPHHLKLIGERLISIPHIKRFRFASKGLAVAPGRVLDEQDGWVDALVEVSNAARRAGKAVAWHTHFNHPAEISWVTELAAQRLFEEGVMVRNQTVLLRGVNDDVATMKGLIRGLADNKIFPVSSV
jgi:lysine 2,3-aminomutase